MAVTNINISAATGINELRRMNSNVLNGNTATTAITWDALTQLSSTNDKDVYVATTGTYGAAVPISDHDGKYVLLVRNVGTVADKTVSIKAGNAPYFGAQNALTVTAAKATAAGSGTETVYVDTALCLDSAKYLQLSGERKGCFVVISDSADVQVALIKLP